MDAPGERVALPKRRAKPQLSNPPCSKAVPGSAITRNRLEPHGRSGYVGNAQLSTLSGRYWRESGGDGTRAIGRWPSFVVQAMNLVDSIAAWSPGNRCRLFATGCRRRLGIAEEVGLHHRPAGRRSLWRGGHQRLRTCFRHYRT